MKNTKSRERGFTLIELMVVISIISLLSSIVLVALKDVRQKAQATKFRAEVDQFIKALELYKVDKGVYPGGGPLSVSSTAGILRRIDPDLGINTLTSSGSSSADPSFATYQNYVDKLYPYIKKIPEPPSYVNPFYFYYTYHDNNCSNNTSDKPYSVAILATNNYIKDSFKDWNLYANPNYRCFSLK